MSSSASLRGAASMTPPSTISTCRRGPPRSCAGRRMPYRIEDLEEAFDVEDEPSAPGREPPREDIPFSDDELIAKALLAKDGDKFRRLWAGDNSEYDGD